MSGFVYIWFDRKHKRYYVGSHWGSPNDGYICSSSWMKSSYKRRPNDFKRRIIKTITTSYKDLIAEEHRYLQMIKREEIRSRYYNLRIDALGRDWSDDSDKANKAAEKISKALKGRKRPDISAALKGVKHSEERRKKTSEAGMGRIVSEETKEKIRQSNLGYKHSDEFKAKRSELNRTIHTGMKRSPEARQRMAEAQRARRAKER